MSFVSIFVCMSQEEHDNLCQNPVIKEYLDQEDEGIGKLRIEEIKTHAKWRIIDEFEEYLRNEIKRFYDGK